MMHARTQLIIAIGGAALIGSGLLVPVLAHDPHGAPGAVPFDLDSPRRPSAQTAAYMDLRTAEVDFGSVQRTVRLTGTVRALPDRMHMITSAVAGTLTRLSVKIGDRVKRGDVIGEIQSTELARMVNDLHKTEIEYEHSIAEVANMNSSIAQLRNQVASTGTQAKLLEEEVARLQAGGEAVGSNVLSAKRAAAVQARSQVTTLTISLEQATKSVISVEKIKESTAKSIVAMRNIIDIIHAHPPGVDPASKTRAEGECGGTFPLYAPIDGLVTRREAVLGQGVEAGKPIVAIADYGQVLIEGDLPESMIARFAETTGQEVRIRRPGSPHGEGPVATGFVRGLSPTVDPIKRTAHLLILADNPAPAQSPSGFGALSEGMFVSMVVVESEAEQSVVVPASAVVTDGPMNFVFVKEKDAYVKRDIVPGDRDDRFVQVKDGLVPGDVVVTRGAYLLTQLRPKAEIRDEHDGHGHSH